MSNDDFLSRWSRRKHAARKGAAEEESPKPVPVAEASTVPLQDASPPQPEPPLPPVESLTTESDFTPFMRPGVDPALRQQAMRTLMRDPRFNVMDGLDVYIDDFSKPDPIPPDWLGKLNQMARLGDYRPPEAEEAAAAVAPQDGAANEKPMVEQQVAELDSPHQSDTPAIGSTPSGLKES